MHLRLIRRSYSNLIIIHPTTKIQSLAVRYFVARHEGRIPLTGAKPGNCLLSIICNTHATWPLTARYVVYSLSRRHSSRRVCALNGSILYREGSRSHRSRLTLHQRDAASRLARSRTTNIVSTNGEKCPGGFITPSALTGLTVRPAGVRIMATIR